MLRRLIHHLESLAAAAVIIAAAVGVCYLVHLVRA